MTFGEPWDFSDIGHIELDPTEKQDEILKLLREQTKLLKEMMNRIHEIGRNTM